MGRVSLFVFIALLFFNKVIPLYGAELDGKRFQIEIVTVEPGVELFERWGHILIVVFDRQEETRKAYNFGTYNFDDPGLLLRYARGFLDFRLSVYPRESRIRYYMSRNRSMVSRILHLTPEQAATIAARLESNALPENRTYAYRHYRDNCCTRIRDSFRRI
ncbi:MAG: DUF4105 domain-containing protein [Acidobacteria bacterium]|nr:DUF4105 domain-containing protein [Acidobacteriota bacterium]